MPALNTTNPTFIDLQKMMAPDGSIDMVSEVLNKTEEMDEITWQEGNLPTGHRHTIRSGLPMASLGGLYKGVVPSKGDTVQVTDTCAQIQSMSEVDARLVAMASDPMRFRWTEDVAHVESMRQRYFSLMWHGSSSEPNEYPGFYARFSDPTAANGDNILDASNGGSPTGSDIHSIWLIVWSPLTCFGIVPKGSPMGLQQEDLGERWLENGDGANGRLKVYSTYFSWYAGLSVRDWRYVVRIANIKLADVKDDAATGPNLPFLMKDAIERLPDFGTGRAAFYMNRRLRQKLRRQVAMGIESSTLTLEDVGGISPKKKLMFDGYPVNRSDTLAAGETALTF